MICTICKRDLPEDSFYKEPRKKNGRRSECKDCRKAKSRVYRKQYYLDNRVKVIAYQTNRYHKKIIKEPVSG